MTDRRELRAQLLAEAGQPDIARQFSRAAAIGAGQGSLNASLVRVQSALC
jgi:hypothetical protein